MSTSHAPRRVVVAYDGSTPARTALDLACDLAAARGLPLHLVCAVDADEAVAAEAFTATARAALASAAALAAARGVATTTATPLGPPSAAVLRQVGPHDLLVTGTHGHRPVARVFLGSTSSALVTHSHAPVLVARRSTAASDAPVVVGVDGSPSSSAAVALAADEADARGVGLRAVLAVPPVVDASGLVDVPDERQLEQARALVAEAVAGLAEDHPDVPVTTSVLVTHPVDALLGAAGAASLLVVGSRGHGVLRRMLLGSVSREVSQRAACPVLVVHPVAARPEQVLPRTAREQLPVALL
jgi:nucleotide-binding universal stress UspA family protein